MWNIERDKAPNILPRFTRSLPATDRQARGDRRSGAVSGVGPFQLRDRLGLLGQRRLDPAVLKSSAHAAPPAISFLSSPEWSRQRRTWRTNRWTECRCPALQDIAPVSGRIGGYGETATAERWNGMTRPEERRCNPASSTELARRWRAVRELMPAAGLDALVVQGMNNFNGTGGYFRWLTGVSVASSYPATVIFPKDAPMTVVGHGASANPRRSIRQARRRLALASALARRRSRRSITACPMKRSWSRAK